MFCFVARRCVPSQTVQYLLASPFHPPLTNYMYLIHHRPIPFRFYVYQAMSGFHFISPTAHSADHAAPRRMLYARTILHPSHHRTWQHRVRTS